MAAEEPTSTPAQVAKKPPTPRHGARGTLPGTPLREGGMAVVAKMMGASRTLSIDADVGQYLGWNVDFHCSVVSKVYDKGWAKDNGVKPGDLIIEIAEFLSSELEPEARRQLLRERPQTITVQAPDNSDDNDDDDDDDSKSSDRGSDNSRGSDGADGLSIGGDLMPTSGPTIQGDSCVETIMSHGQTPLGQDGLGGDTISPLSDLQLQEIWKNTPGQAPHLDAMGAPSPQHMIRGDDVGTTASEGCCKSSGQCCSRCRLRCRRCYDRCLEFGDNCCGGGDDDGCCECSD